MTEFYTNESAAKLLLEVTGMQEIPENCGGLTACLNAAIAKIQSSYTPSDKRIEVGDYVEIDLRDGWYIDGVVDHVPRRRCGDGDAMGGAVMSQFSLLALWTWFRNPQASFSEFQDSFNRAMRIGGQS